MVLLFFPLAFSGVCTEELCRVAEDWSRWEELGASVLGISVDSPFVNRRFAEETKVPFPLLSDFNKDASSAYGVLYPDYFGLQGVSKRSAFVVDRDGKIGYAWVSEDADVLPPSMRSWRWWRGRVRARKGRPTRASAPRPGCDSRRRSSRPPPGGGPDPRVVGHRASTPGPSGPAARAISPAGTFRPGGR